MKFEVIFTDEIVLSDSDITFLSELFKEAKADEHRNIRFSETEKSDELNPKGVS